MSARILTGDCRTVLRTLPSESVHCIVTSPPYFGLRDYQVAGQIGLEETPDAYVKELVAIFRECRRVLRNDGTVWLVLGDSYSSGGRDDYGTLKPGTKQATHAAIKSSKRPPSAPGVKPKDLLGIPWAVAFALRADGWYLRQDIIWSKPNPMPESVRDRCTKAHEYLFLLSKSGRYFFDQDAVRLPPAASSLDRWAQDVEHQEGSDRVPGKTNGMMKAVGGVRRRRPNGASTQDFIPGENTCGVPEAGVNIRSVWTVATQPFSEAHFATFPPALIEPCIKAGCPEGGTVLDPFGGAGTTALVADRLHRNSIIIELNPDYAAMAERRLHGDAGMFASVQTEAA